MAITITRNGDRLDVRTPFALKDTVKELPGRRWDDKRKVWHVPATQAAAQAIRDTLPGQLHVDRQVLDLMAGAERAAAALEHKTADQLPEFPGKVCQCPGGPTPGNIDRGENPLLCLACELSTGSMLHQRQAYYFAEPRDATMLAMDMGTGKSKTAIGLLDGWGIDVAIILAPVKAVRVWPREFHGGDVKGFHGHSDRPWHTFNGIGLRGRSGKVLRKPTMQQRVDGARDTIVRAGRMKQPAAVVFNYEAFWQNPCRDFLVKHVRRLAEEHYGRPVKIACILDESHKVKAPNGKWSRTAATVAGTADKTLALTGTPNPHSEPDLYAQFRALDAGVFGTNYQNFLRKYFELGGYEDREVQGFISAETERAFIQAFASMSYICDSDDVLDLPPEVDLPTYTCKLGPDAAKHYATMEAEYYAVLKDQPDDDGDEVLAPNTLAQLIRLAQITSGHLPVGDKDEGTHRIVTVDTAKADLLDEVLDDLPTGRPDEPIVIFGRFHHDLATIQATAEKRGLRYAEISGRKGVRDGLTADAKMIDDVDIVGVQLQAGGVGVDLTRARYGVYYSLDFNLGDFKQSRKRLHRPGQTRPTTFIFLACEGTVDEVIANALHNRDAVLTALKNAAKNHDAVPA